MSIHSNLVKRIILFLLIILSKGLTAQPSIKMISERDMTIILAAVEGPFLRNIDTIFISAKTPVLHTINDTANHWVYVLATPDRKEKFYFVIQANQTVIRVFSNIIQSDIKQSPLNEQIKNCMGSTIEFYQLLNKVYKTQYEAFSAKNMDGYHAATALADSISRNFGQLTSESILMLPDSALSQFKLIAFYHYFTDRQLLRVLEQLAIHSNLYMLPAPMKKLFKAKENTQTGKKAPDIWLTTINYEHINFSLKGNRSNLVIFSASWCKPCKVLKSQLALSLRDQSLGDRVEVFVHSTERDENGLKLAREEALGDPKNWHYILLKEGDEGLPAQLSIGGLPTVLMIDKDGIIQYISVGYNEMDFEAMMNVIRRL